MDSHACRARHPALPFEKWPAADQKAWVAATRPAPLCKAAGKGTSWRAKSRQSALTAYGRWLGWLSGQGVDLNAVAPADRITQAWLQQYVAFLQAHCAPFSVAGYVGVMCMVVAALFPSDDWSWLRRVQAQLYRNAEPSRDKSDEMVPAEEMLLLGLGLMETSNAALNEAATENEQSDRRKRERAARDYRDGLIIAFLANCPLRVANLLQMEIGKHLLISDGQVVLRFAAAETKTKRRIVTIWPSSLRVALDRYLAKIRPMLVAANIPGRDHQASARTHGVLWVGQGGTTLTEGGLAKIMKRHTVRHFGKRIPAQRFRDVSATTIAHYEPDNVRNAALLLGHTGLRTTERNYIQPNAIIACERYAELQKEKLKELMRTERELD